MIFDGYMLFPVDDYRHEYFGPINSNGMHGYGKLVLKNGKSYSGKWANGVNAMLTEDLESEQTQWVVERELDEKARKKHLEQMLEVRKEERLILLRDTNEKVWMEEMTALDRKKEAEMYLMRIGGGQSYLNWIREMVDSG